MKKLRRIFTIILAIELLVLGLNHVQVNSAKVVRAFNSILVTFPSFPLFNETNWIPGSSATRSFQIENTDFFSKTVGMKAVNFANGELSGLLNPLSSEIVIQISVGGIPVYGDASPTGHKHLQDFYNEQVVWLTALGPGAQVSVDIMLRLHDETSVEFQGQNTHFDIVVGTDEVIKKLKPLKPLPRLKPLPTLPGLQPLQIL